MANPVLVEVLRGDVVESRHRGSIVVIDHAGRKMLALGEASAPVYPRSAIKLLQAIPLVTTGAIAEFGFGQRELALACSSHNGEPRHTELANAMLMRTGLDVSALECGAHVPSLDKAARELLLTGARPSPLHNNCSGKHAGMLAVARHIGEPTQGYVRPGHPVQLRIASVLEELTGCQPSADVCAVDGCSVPTWALPLDSWALAFARIADQAAGGSELLAGGRKLMAACMAEPAYVAGERRFCTDVMEAMAGSAFVKTGAEGVFCAALPGKGIGIALKIDDGATRASEAAMAGVLAALVDGHAEMLTRWSRKPVRNVAGAQVGEVRLRADLARAFQILKVH